MGVDVSRTDMRTIVKYLSDAAYLYSEKKGQRYVCRAEMIKRLINKLERRCGE